MSWSFAPLIGVVLGLIGGTMIGMYHGFRAGAKAAYKEVEEHMDSIGFPKADDCGDKKCEEED